MKIYGQDVEKILWDAYLRIYLFIFLKKRYIFTLKCSKLVCISTSSIL